MAEPAAAGAAALDPLEPRHLVAPHHDDKSLNDTLLDFVWQKPGKGWLMLFGVTLTALGGLVLGVGYTLAKGIGVWGNNQPVGWAFDIINFVWWVGIGHAGTLISAILLLFQQKWRTSINRFAEAMTLFAVMCAGLFPLLHTGRPWFAFWLIPYPSTLAVWPQFRSPLVWDVFAISTYLTVSALFWYIGLIPDLAALRDSSKTKLQRILYGIFSLGWRGSGRHWHHYKIGYLILAGISTPLVLSVHTIVSFDFAVSVLPGWHTTVFPPYFVAGAVFSGFAMVVTLMVPARKYMGLRDVITERHLENMNKVILATGLIVSYGYMMEHFVAWYSQSQYEIWTFYVNRAQGPYAGVYWLMIACNVVTPNIFWFKKARTSIPIMWVAAILVNVGMWCERFIIIVTSLHQDFLPSSWDIYTPTWVDWTIYVGTLGLFGTLFMLFLKFVPAVAISEVKELQQELKHAAHHGSSHHGVEQAAAGTLTHGAH
ncbi:NrfD/PsrC family molybdoenzyme membrane anchor subunit [Hyalangium sp.]|uniref:NrfD/PsrC family molybdoenzyme membrane anchor subunit n=1 Tax=Hyalangium sp. TaxID=2028555 RepID=UPI002D4F4E42|nr:NrfD/PsrC family molybdoenzyme membrane anchor subunit [Hyalangium sp.]HYI00877.1 NrfD/PsrC family molybdoenzyme membrane anchor subunit [Hyalangium sp.]